ncbi:hypothetical protein BP5796_10547 [Coleophoma crateriformis]|uniref:Glycosyltransferase family 8 protein n=1 Tax=Coleophoma crateriformis TaxID=565419 RepID=A0A3D8QQH1_9HELO|nr:hypothetical protein BP5796_10547 [Coleophoma crateriformis]
MGSALTEGRKLFTLKAISALFVLSITVFLIGQSNHTAVKIFTVPIQNVANKLMKSKAGGVLRQEKLANLPNKTGAADSNGPEHTTSRNAFALFLTPPHGAGKDSDDLNDDDYFVATRMLVYQLLYDPSTRTNNSYPVVILATQNVAQTKLDRLRNDGPDVRVVGRLALNWGKTRKAWQDVLTKLRLFQLTEFEKVLFLDSDTLLTRPMDGIFEDPAARPTKNKGATAEDEAPEDEGAQPREYIFAGNAGAGRFNHTTTWPPIKGRHLNAGCMVFHPSEELYEYYLRIAGLKDCFDGRFPEQSLWAYAHRRDGNMPWKQMGYMWNINKVTWSDVEHGVASLHVKWWSHMIDPRLKDLAMRIRGRMEGFWEGKESHNILE